MIEDPEERKYDEVTNIVNLIKQVEAYLADFNGVSKRPMNLAIFLFAVEHVSRICRILKQPGGHMLLVGVGGSGRQSLTRLSGAIYQMDVYQVCNLMNVIVLTLYKIDIIIIVIKDFKIDKFQM